MTLLLDTTAKEDQLRKQALIFCMLQTLLASTIPAIEYAYVLKYDNYGLGPQAFTTWGISIIVSLIGVLAHSAASTTLTIVHIVINALLNIALAGYITAWSFILRLQCSIAQESFYGCNATSCPCAGVQSCNAEELTYSGCISCKAPYADVCSAVNQEYNVYLLSFWGLAVIVAAAPTLYLDIYILITVNRYQSSILSRLQSTSIAVDQQTRLIAAGDKPTVTPGTLSDWVSDLIFSEESRFVAVAEKCRAALRKRGYELPVHSNNSNNNNLLPSMNTTTTTATIHNNNNSMKVSYGTGQGLFRAATHSTMSFEDTTGTTTNIHDANNTTAVVSQHSSSTHENQSPTHRMHRGRLKSQQIVPYPPPTNTVGGMSSGNSNMNAVDDGGDVVTVVVAKPPSSEV